MGTIWKGRNHMTKTPTEKLVETLKKQLIGTDVPKKDKGEAGRFIEREIHDITGTQNGKGCDIEAWGVEIKSRDIDSTSAITIGSEHIDTIKNEPYENTAICEKTQHIILVKTQDRKIIDIEYLNFSDDNIQHQARASYNHGQKILKQGLNANPNYVETDGHPFYFENTTHENDSWAFRIRWQKLCQLNQQTKTTFNKIFEMIT